MSNGRQHHAGGGRADRRRPGDAEQSDASAVGYVLALLLAATAFGTLATSYARRAGLGARVMLIGICGAPVVLGSVLVILPAILRAVGLLSVP